MSSNASDPDLKEQISILTKNIDFFFMIIMGIAILLLTIGFALMEAGFYQSKNSTNAMFKGFMDFVICGIVWWLFGYTLAFGEGNSFLGIYYYQGGRDLKEKEQYTNFFYQITYATTAAALLSGAIVGRLNIWSYFFYTASLSGVAYPIVVHWGWYSDGWLMKLGYKDFCGAGIVHLMGGSCALMGAIILGPRMGQFPKKEERIEPRDHSASEHHNLIIAGIGILTFIPGALAFNGGSALHIAGAGQGELVSRCMINTWLCCSGSSIGALVLFKLGLGDGKKRWSFVHSVNSGVSGFVSVCAHVDSFDLWAAFVTGLFTSLTYTYIRKLMVKLKIDDPLDSTAIHFGGGLWGVTIPSILRSDSLVGGNFKYAGWLLAYQIAGALAIIVWSMGFVGVLFGVLRLTGLLRATPEAEISGADVADHKEPCYVGTICNNCPNNTKFQNEFYPYVQSSSILQEHEFKIPRNFHHQPNVNNFGIHHTYPCGQLADKINPYALTYNPNRLDELQVNPNYIRS